MSLVPYEDPEPVIIHRSELKPSDPSDPPSRWRQFLDAVRAAVGLKPLYLCERWAEARVRKEEVKTESDELDNEIKLLKAKQEYELITAKVREQDAKTKQIEAKTLGMRAQTRLMEKAAKAAQISPAEADAWLASIKQRIELEHGGHIEVELPEPPSADQS
jgi:hypothetical protein